MTDWVAFPVPPTQWDDDPSDGAEPLPPGYGEASLHTSVPCDAVPCYAVPCMVPEGAVGWTPEDPGFAIVHYPQEYEPAVGAFSTGFDEGYE